jgi:hypothetical protein
MLKMNIFATANPDLVTYQNQKFKTVGKYVNYNRKLKMID